VLDLSETEKWSENQETVKRGEKQPCDFQRQWTLGSSGWDGRKQSLDCGQGNMLYFALKSLEGKDINIHWRMEMTPKNYVTHVTLFPC